MNSGSDKNLIRIVSILEMEGIFYWLDQGSLLGAIRDNHLLPWDNDIDLSVWEEDFDKITKLSGTFKKYGFYFEIHDYKDGVWLSRGRSAHIEIAKQSRQGDVVIRKNAYPHNSVSGRLIKSILQLMPTGLHFRLRGFGRRYFSKPPVIFKTPARYFSEFTQIEFLGLKINVPARYEDYLEFKYGKEWRTPKKQWDFSKEDGAVKFNKKND